jgi:putative restriction endonuclease
LPAGLDVDQAHRVTESVIERELAVRLAAQAWLDADRAQGREGWTQANLADFQFGGTRIPLMDRQRGIRKPAGMAAALSMRTVYRPSGAARPYEDGTGIDGLLRYKWRGDDPDHAENRALREAMDRELPLIWFYGFAEGLYSAIYPVYLRGEEPGLQQFVVALGEDQRLVDVGHSAPEALRRYVERTTWHRLHQPAFRAGVMLAYDTRCAVCSIRHSQLLDAAHITADADERGEPVTSNGLALCKIHHGAFDAGIMGIRPNLTLHVRADVLAEIDGPMLRHGIQAHHDQALMVVPTTRRDRPDTARLEERYAQFLAR